MPEVKLENIEKEYKQVQADLKQVRDQLKASAEKTLSEIKSIGDTTAETKTTADKALSEFNALNAKFKDLQQRLERPKGEVSSQSMTIGQHFINNEESQKISSSYRGKISVSMPRNEITSAGLTV